MTLDRRLARAVAACSLFVTLPTIALAAVMGPLPTDTEISSVNTPVWLAMSPLGDSLYVVNGNSTVSVYDVAAGVMTLTQSVSGGGNCDSVQLSLNNATSVAVSPDGHHVYVTSSSNPNKGNRITVWDRDYTSAIPNRGELTCKQNLIDNTNLRKATGLSISADGKTVYATSTTRKQERVSAFSRDTTTGRLVFLQSVKDDATLRLNTPRATAVSSDGKNVYVAASGDDAVTKFDRNAAGSLSNSAALAFTDPTHLVVSADGKNVYAISPGQTRIRVYNRNAASGVISLNGDMISPTVLAGTQGGVAVTPDGAWVFGVANDLTNGSALFVASRDGSTGALAFVASQAITNGGTRFVVSSPDSQCAFVAAESISSVVSYCFNARDYGDALQPSTSAITYPTLKASSGPSHSVDAGVHLGIGTPDAEGDGQPTLNADGDDTDLSGDDENGAALSSPTILGGSTSNFFNLTGSGVADGWVDFNGNGAFEASEKVCTGVTLPGTCNLNSVPPVTATGNVVARFRARASGSVTLGPTGGGGDGEVEDHLVAISSDSFQVTVTKAGNGTGTITSSPVGINCPGSCSTPFARHANVILTAAPDNPGVANEPTVAWSGPDSASCSGNTCTFTDLQAAKAVTATFTLKTYALTVSVAGSGNVQDVQGTPGALINCNNGGAPDCSETAIPYNTQVELHPTPLDSSWVFTGWTGACTNTTGDCVVTMTAASAVTAHFQQGVFTLLVNAEAGSGTGTVTVTGITGNSPATCVAGVDPQPCAFFPTSGDNLVLTQSPDGDSIFADWTDDCPTVPNTTTCSFSGVTADHTVGADFEVTPDLRAVIVDDYVSLVDTNTANAVTIVAKVSNVGSVDPSGNATITATLPGNVTINTWDCASTGSVATTCGGGTVGNTLNVNRSVSLPIGAELTFTFHGTASANPPYGGIFLAMNVADPDPEGAVVGLDNADIGFYAYKRISKGAFENGLLTEWNGGQTP